MRVIKFVLVLATVGLLSACGGKSIWDTDAEVSKYTHIATDAPYLELKTMISNTTGSGGHSSLVINGTQTVMYDPAGRWDHPYSPERNDVRFGMTPQVLSHYDSWHARDTHHVVSQRIYVTPQVAQQAMQLAFGMGPSLDAQCSYNTSFLLKQLPGFEGLPRSYFPQRLMNAFGELPNVQTRKLVEKDEGKNG